MVTLHQFCHLLRSFDPRKECDVRKYSYLLPAKLIGIESKLKTTEVDCHISDFKDILNSFQVGNYLLHLITYSSDCPSLRCKKHDLLDLILYSTVIWEEWR